MYESQRKNGMTNKGEELENLKKLLTSSAMDETKKKLKLNTNLNMKSHQLNNSLIQMNINKQMFKSQEQVIGCNDTKMALFVLAGRCNNFHALTKRRRDG